MSTGSTSGSRRPARTVTRAWVPLVAVFAGVVAHNARAVLRAREHAETHVRPLEHAATVGEGLGPPLRLAVLGDSSADGFGLSDPAAAFPGQTAARLAARTGRRVDVRAVAHRGARTRDVVDDQVPVLAAHDPDVVAILVGVNDALGRRRTGQVERETRELVAAVQDAAPGARLVIGVCPDLRRAPGLPRPLHALVSWRCRRVAHAQRRALRDTAALAAELERAPRPDEFGPDGFHPGERGSAQLAQRVVDTLFDAPDR